MSKQTHIQKLGQEVLIKKVIAAKVDSLIDNLYIFESSL